MLQMLKKNRLQSNLEYVIGEFNDQYILDNINKCEYIIFAWGGKSAINKKAYDERIDNLMNLLKQCDLSNKQIFRVNDKKGSNRYPFHACYWSNSFKKIVYQF